MGAFNGGAFLILLALAALLVFRRELTAWIDGRSTARCEFCDGTAQDGEVPSLCSRCTAAFSAEVARAQQSGAR